jgi:cobaltochelatase CobS
MKDANFFGKVECRICGAKAHFLEMHLTEVHGMTAADYLKTYPDAKVLSEAAEHKLSQIASDTRNQKVVVKLKDLFGANPFGNPDRATIEAFKAPRPNTPKTDPNYYFNPEILAVVLYAIQNQNMKLLLVGPTGSGKTSIAEQVAARLNRGFYRINFDGDITRADLVGQWVLTVKNEMHFQYGILPKAMREGAVLVLDEWDCVNPSVGMVLQSMIEGKPLTITETGEVIEPHPDFRLIATANTVGQGDDTGLYNGTQPQNFATLDRFTVVEHVDYPTQAKEKKILTQTTGITDDDVLDKLTRTAKLIREAFVKQEIRATMSTRTVVNAARLMLDWGSPKRAYTLGFLNKLTTEDQNVCLEVIQRIWGI